MRVIYIILSMSDAWQRVDTSDSKTEVSYYEYISIWADDIVVVSAIPEEIMR